MTYLGGTGQRKMVDSTIPAGTHTLTYQLQAVRSTVAGPWAEFTVKFGQGGTTTVSQTSPVKLAA